MPFWSPKKDGSQGSTPSGPGGLKPQMSVEQKQIVKAESYEQLKRDKTWLTALFFGDDTGTRVGISTLLPWYFLTLLVGLFVIVLSFISWTTVSPFEHGTWLIKAVSGESAIFKSLAWMGAFCCFILYLCDFYTAPHLAAKGSHFENLNVNKLLDRKKARRSQVRKDDAEHKSIPHHFVWGGSGGYSPCLTTLARIFFTLSIILVLMYGLVDIDKYPTRPILITMILFPALQYMLRAVISARHHRGITDEVDCITQIDEALEVLVSHGHESTEHVVAAARVEVLLEERAHREADKGYYYKATSASTLTLTIGMIIFFSLWTYDYPGYQFDGKTKDMFAEDGVDDEDVQWAIWAGPSLVICSYFIFTIAYFLRSYMNDMYSESDTDIKRVLDVMKSEEQYADNRKKVAEEEMESLISTVKITVNSILLICLGFWLCAQISGGSSEAGATVKRFVAGFIVFFTIFICMTMNRLFIRIKAKIAHNKFLKMVAGWAKSDWLKSSILLFFPYGIPMYFGLSWMNKRVRDCRCIKDRRHLDPDDPKEPPVEGNWFTLVGTHHYQRIMKMNITSIVNKAYFLGFILATLNVFAEKCLYLLLIYIGDGFDEIILPKAGKICIVAILWYLTGLFMFLLPPVPGPPVYLFGGVVVVRVFAVDSAGVIDEAMFWWGILFTSIASWVLKLNACAMQQKCIGESFGSSPAVRAACGVHTSSIRAVELILMEPGLTFGKVAILCGGPDWPTSVLTGLLKCKLSQMMLGTAPIIVFVTPVVMTGAFFLRPEPTYATMGGFLLLTSMIICTGFGVLAGFSVTNALDKHPHLLTIPLKQNQELDWIAFKDEKKSEIYAKRCEWSTLSCSMKFSMIFGVLLLNISGAMFTWYGDFCFGDFDLQTSSGDFKTGKIKIIKPLGIIACSLFALSIIVFKLYRMVLRGFAQAEQDKLEASFENDRIHKTGVWKEWCASMDAKVLELEEEMKTGFPEDYRKYQNAKKHQELTDAAEKRAAAAAAASESVKNPAQQMEMGQMSKNKK